MLDRDGNRINRRNPQDIFTPLYDHQIPPGAAQVVHYRLDVPADVTGPVELTVAAALPQVRLRVHEARPQRTSRSPKLPIVDMCEDTVTLPVAGVAGRCRRRSRRSSRRGSGGTTTASAACSRAAPAASAADLKQAEAAFKKLLTLGVPDAVPHGHLNLARVYIDEGRQEAAAAGAREGQAIRAGEVLVEARVAVGTGQQRVRPRPRRRDRRPAEDRRSGQSRPGDQSRLHARHRDPELARQSSVQAGDE